MKLVRLIEGLRQRPRLLARVGYGVLALLVVIDAMPWLVDKAHAHTAAERWPGFWAVFGLVGCALIVFLSKAFGHAGIMKREEYYDE
jgi:heme/copper-type cytochrome/quinol oxidase subunit 1